MGRMAYLRSARTLRIGGLLLRALTIGAACHHRATKTVEAACGFRPHHDAADRYPLQNNSWRSRTDETPACGPKIWSQSAIAPGAGANATLSSWAHGQVDAIPATICP